MVNVITLLPPSPFSHFYNIVFETILYTLRTKLARLVMGTIFLVIVYIILF